MGGERVWSIRLFSDLNVFFGLPVGICLLDPDARPNLFTLVYREYRNNGFTPLPPEISAFSAFPLGIVWFTHILSQAGFRNHQTLCRDHLLPVI